MPANIKAIAQRIKELRTINGLYPEALAKEFKISLETYKKYEQGDKDIPVGLLYEVAQKFNVELTTLLTGDEPHLHAYCLVKKNLGPAVDRRKEYKYKDLAYNFVNKKAEVFMVTVTPGKKSDIHYYSHPGQEFNYILEGSLQVLLEGHEITLDQGDAFYFNSGLKHAMVALHGKPARFLAVIL